MLANREDKPFNKRDFVAPVFCNSCFFVTLTQFRIPLNVIKEPTPTMTLPVLMLPFVAIVIGLIVLVWSADKFVYGAASLAQSLGMSTLMIGLTIVALGTSAPEIMVSIISSIGGSPTLAIGNALGSNIANIGLVLGVTTLVCALPTQSRLLRKELPLLLLVTVGAIALLANQEFTALDGSLLLVGLALFIIWLIMNSKSGGDISSESSTGIVDSTDNGQSEDQNSLSTGKSIFWFLFALALLLCSSKMLVWGAIEIALELGIDEVIIGLTIVAIGTSLPELAASIISALKGHHDLAIGNVIGSNILNLLTVMPFPGLLAAGPINAEIFWRDGLTVMGLTAVLALFLYTSAKKGKLNRFHGVSFLCIYCGYLWVLYQASATTGI